jgi:hypothetical protein
MRPFDNFVDGTRIRFSFQGKEYESVIESHDLGNLLHYGSSTFASLEAFVGYILEKAGVPPSWTMDQYMEGAWELCQFLKSGQWYSCEEMIPPPPPSPDVLESVREMNNGTWTDDEKEVVKTLASRMGTIPPLPESPPPPQADIHLYVYFTPETYDYVQLQKRGDQFEALYVPWTNSLPMSSLMMNRESVYTYIWSFLEMVSLHPNNVLEVRIPGFPITSVNTSRLPETKEMLYRAIGLSLNWVNVKN